MLPLARHWLLVGLPLLVLLVLLLPVLLPPLGLPAVLLLLLLAPARRRVATALS